MAHDDHAGVQNIEHPTAHLLRAEAAAPRRADLQPLSGADSAIDAEPPPGADDPTGREPSPVPGPSVGPGMRLRALRIRFGLSQRELARRAGVTNGAVSMIELGQVSPTVGSLQKLALVMSMTLAQFFAADVSRAEPSFFRASDLLEIGGDGVSLRLVPPGVAASELQMLRERYAPGTGTGETLLSHEGEKAGVVVAGRICIQVGGRKAELGPGDAYHFDGLIPHRFRNVGTVDCELISVATPRRV